MANHVPHHPEEGEETRVPSPCQHCERLLLVAWRRLCTHSAQPGRRRQRRQSLVGPGGQRRESAADKKSDGRLAQQILSRGRTRPHGTRWVGVRRGPGIGSSGGNVHFKHQPSLRGRVGWSGRGQAAARRRVRDCKFCLVNEERKGDTLGGRKSWRKRTQNPAPLL